MDLLSSLPASPNVVIVGASGGIGAALTRIVASNLPTATVHAFSRSGVDFTAANIHSRTLDITDERSIRLGAAGAARDDAIDLVIVATGMLHRFPGLKPEKSMRELNQDAMAEVFAINTIGPALVAKHFLPRMATDEKTVFAVLSARVGSIKDNRLGGWTSYRASKAALNMILRTLAIEQRRRARKSVLAALHPGTVDTGLSKPFQRRVPESQLFTPDRAAVALLGVIDRLTADDSGGFFAWDGTRIDY